jgi:hypothetical protein
MNDNFPELTPSFLAGQDLLYSQFNDVSFFVEDTEQEHLYFNILKRLFPNIIVSKIFPLHGNGNLKTHAKANIGNKKKIYIADLDFDEILGSKEDIDNVFYLNKYSIENYLIEQSGVYEVIREKKPKLKNKDISDSLNLTQVLHVCKKLLSELACTFIVIQSHSLGKVYFGINPARDFNIEPNNIGYKNSFISAYFNEVEALLKNIDRRFSLQSKCRPFKCHFRSINKAMSNIPGKYILNLLKFQLVKLKLINDMAIESFTYKLAKECNTNCFNHLKEDILRYRN